MTLQNTWSAYWENIDDSQRVFRIEARDYATRVQRILQPTKSMTVLDFGCGFGHTARELAPSVGNIALWDASSNVRRQALERVRDLGNATMLDLQQADDAGLRNRFDLILVHSVLQYMSPDEIRAWLARWRGMLKREGRLVLSDLLRPGAGGFGELFSYLMFALRHGFFWNAFTAGVRETARYWSARKSAPLTVLPRQVLE
ncbi:MAG: class I SAM-dependent methyltransferase, partial [Steroidobacteraceae bacterium]